MSLSRFYDVVRTGDGSLHIETSVLGYQLLHLPLLNKGTAFTEEERSLLKLHGLLPPRIDTMALQISRMYGRYLSLAEPIQKYTFLRMLQDTNEVLFFALLEQHLEEMLPIIYTPTVGEAVSRYSALYQTPRGLVLSLGSTEHALEAVSNVPLDDVRMIVATDSSAILGIGDQGVGGMAISIGKLAIYTAAGGIGPDKVLPVELDVGTNRGSLREDPHYLGRNNQRLTGAAYLNFVDQFVMAVKQRYPKVIIQWEDFAKEAAFTVLERYRNIVPSFNDDIQGTGAMALAGVLAASRMQGVRLSDQRIVISGAGAGGIGVASLLVAGLMAEGLSREAAVSRVVVLDSRGVLVNDRELEDYKRPYAQTREELDSWAPGGNPGLAETVEMFGATVLIGLSGQGGQFDRKIVEQMAANSARPVIFPLSNPTENTEVLPQDLVDWTGGTVIMAAGSPFAPVEYQGGKIPVPQGNNAFVFPGIGFGSVLARVSQVTDEMIVAAAHALAEYTVEHHPGRAYPPVAELQEVSIRVAARVIQAAISGRVASELGLYGLSHEELTQVVRDRFWHPRYLPYRVATGNRTEGDE